MGSGDYKNAWTRPNTLDQLNHRIHDGVAVEDLWARAEDRRDAFFVSLFPYAAPAEGSKVLELGQGVGWIMQATLDAYPISEIVGLDVSQNMVDRAGERWQDPRGELRHLRRSPRATSRRRVRQHLLGRVHPAHREAPRLPRDAGAQAHPQAGRARHARAALRAPPGPGRTWEDEAWHHVNGSDAHWHHYYSYDELYVLFARELDVTDFDIKYFRTSFWVHFSKGTRRRFHDKAVENEYFLNRSVPGTIASRNDPGRTADDDVRWDRVRGQQARLRRDGAAPRRARPLDGRRRAERGPRCRDQLDRHVPGLRRVRGGDRRGRRPPARRVLPGQQVRLPDRPTQGGRTAAAP